MNKKNPKKAEDEIYCPECGKPVKRKAIICPHCGIQLKDLETRKDIPAIRVEPEITPKKKWVALVLAFFFSFWAWIYTYKRSYIKFWIVSCITIVLFSIIFLSMCSAACSATIDELSYEEGVGTDEEFIFMTGLTVFWWIYCFCIWLWVLIDYAARPKSFYKYYPKEQ
jgi:hypothetical protein